jgi:hypothetical protein
MDKMSNFYNTNDTIEQLLQTEADKYRMYPSDKVWVNINAAMHEKKRWPALMIGFVAIVAALSITTVLFYPAKKEYAIVDNNIENKNIVQATVKHFKNAAAPTKKNVVPLFLNTHLNIKNNKNNSIQKNNIVDSKLIEVENVFIATSIDNKALQPIEVVVNNNKISTNNNVKNGVEIACDKAKNTASFFNNKNINIANTLLATNNNAATNLLKNIAKINLNKKWKMQYYATPSISYRVLEDDKTREKYIANNNSTFNTNVNDVVHHKPAIGLELGITVMYPITKTFFIKTGLQFNVRKYDIDATTKSVQTQISYIANNQLNSTTYSSAYSTAIRGNGSNNDVVLENKTYQLSVPIGLQWNFLNGQRWGLAASATMQPTITLNKNVYAVSTDYKSYIDGTSFFRKWNLNSSAELLLTLKFGNNAKWFFGPQIRNQQLPTYNDIYPIKEYRIDYGIKIGFTKNF